MHGAGDEGIAGTTGCHPGFHDRLPNFLLEFLVDLIAQHHIGIDFNLGNLNHGSRAGEDGSVDDVAWIKYFSRSFAERGLQRGDGRLNGSSQGSLEFGQFHELDFPKQVFEGGAAVIDSGQSGLGGRQFILKSSLWKFGYSLLQARIQILEIAEIIFVNRIRGGGRSLDGGIQQISRHQFVAYPKRTIDWIAGSIQKAIVLSRGSRAEGIALASGAVKVVQKRIYAFDDFIDGLELRRLGLPDEKSGTAEKGYEINADHRGTLL